MRESDSLPDFIRRLEPDAKFNFACHHGVKCFTECCRMLELSLTPYDVLRLRQGTGKTSTTLLEEVIISEQDPGEPFPRFYLSMVDDGRASCTYVTPGGCSIYKHRPGACRAYPLGRAARRVASDEYREYFVLVKEPHCQGFAENTCQDAHQYMVEQGLEKYNQFNDKVAAILQHESIRQGFVPSQQQVALFTLALYDLDNFRNQLLSGTNTSLPNLQDSERTRIMDDEELLQFAIDWLQDVLFAPF